MGQKDRIINRVLDIAIAFGILLALYPIISQGINLLTTINVNREFDVAAQTIASPEVARRLDLAHAYNETLDPRKIADPFTKRQEEGKAEYARMLEVREQIGYVRIPDIMAEVPVYAGTSRTVLQKGAGHLEGTSLPVGGKHTHTVITAHRGIPSKKLFTNLPELEVGDKFYFHNLGEVLCYQVDKITIVDPDDFSEVLVTPGQDYATLLTCTPYMINSHRLLVRGVRVDYDPYVEEKAITNQKMMRIIKIVIYVFLAILVVMVIRRRKKRKNMG